MIFQICILPCFVTVHYFPWLRSSSYSINILEFISLVGDGLILDFYLFILHFSFLFFVLMQPSDIQCPIFLSIKRACFFIYFLLLSLFFLFLSASSGSPSICASIVYDATWSRWCWYFNLPLKFIQYRLLLRYLFYLINRTSKRNGFTCM